MAPFEAITEVGLFGEPDAESPPGVPTYMQSKNAIGASTSFFAAEPKPGSDPYRASMSALRLWRRAAMLFSWNGSTRADEASFSVPSRSHHRAR